MSTEAAAHVLCKNILLRKYENWLYNLKKVDADSDRYLDRNLESSLYWISSSAVHISS